MKEEHLIDGRPEHRRRVERFLNKVDARVLNGAKPWATCRVCGGIIGLKKRLPKRQRRNAVCRDCQRVQATKIAQSEGVVP